MAKFSMKQGDKEVGNAAVYAVPHNMKGGPVTDSRVNQSEAKTLDMSVGAISKSAGNESIKTDGIKIRGTGAATKGLMARGPMA